MDPRTQALLENEEIRRQVSQYIEEETIVSSDSDNDIVIVEENVNKNSQTERLNINIDRNLEVAPLRQIIVKNPQARTLKNSEMVMSSQVMKNNFQAGPSRKKDSELYIKNIQILNEEPQAGPFPNNVNRKSSKKKTNKHAINISQEEDSQKGPNESMSINKNSISRKRQNVDSDSADQPAKTGDEEKAFVHILNSKYAGVCGLQVSIKSLLKNEEIRRQLAPYIQEERISTGASTSNETMVKSRKVQENAIEEVIVPGLPQFSDSEEEEILKQVSISQGLIVSKSRVENFEDKNSASVNSLWVDIQQPSTSQPVQIEHTSDESADEVVRKVLKKKYKKVPKRRENTNSSEGLECEVSNSRFGSDNDVPLLESDDWYYLNIVNNKANSDIDVENCIKEDCIVIGETVKTETKPSEIHEIVIIEDANEKSKVNKLQTQNKTKKYRKPTEFGRTRRRTKKKKKEQINMIVPLQGKIVKRNLITEVCSISQERYEADEESVTKYEPKNGYENSIQFKHDDIILDDDVILDSIESLGVKKIRSMIGIPFSDSSNASTKNDISESDAISTEGSMSGSTSSNKVKRVLPALKPVSRTYIDNTELLQKERDLAKKTIIGSCSVCGKVFERYASLRRHQERCNVGVFKCVMCPFNTENKSTFRNHVGQHILGNGYTKFKANEIKKKTNGLHIYIKVHCTTCNADRKATQNATKCKKCQSHQIFYCSLCMQTFKTYLRVRQHVFFSINKTFINMCSKCQRSGFESFCKLKNHEKVCTIRQKLKGFKIPFIRLIRCEDEMNLPKVPPYMLQAYCSKCEVSEVAFKDQAYCKECHSEFTFKCEMCEKTHNTYESLCIHALETHKVETFQCNKCGIVVGQLFLLKNHEKSCKTPVRSVCYKSTFNAVNSHDENVRPYNLEDIIGSVTEVIT